MSLPVNSVSTADLVSAARAWHLRSPNPVFEDPFARVLCGRLLGLALKMPPVEWFLFQVALAHVMPAHLCVVMRARYAEEALERAIAAGVKQYVIIGAGMDSFAFRRPDLLQQIDAYEIDHPVTQRRKLRRIRRARLRVPANHHFVAADLSKVSTVDALAGSPFDMSRRTFMSLLGVAYYLTPDDLAKTARSIARSLPPGTRLVLDYMLDEKSSSSEHLELRRKLLNFVKRRGEPMRGAYSLDRMNALMDGEGLRAVESFPITELGESYRAEFGTLPFEIPGLFGFGTFEVEGRGA